MAAQEEQREWFLPDSSGTGTLGPYTTEAMIAKIRAAEVRADEYVWGPHLGDQGWKRIFEVEELREAIPSRPMAAPPLPPRRPVEAVATAAEPVTTTITSNAQPTVTQFTNPMASPEPDTITVTQENEPIVEREEEVDEPVSTAPQIPVAPAIRASAGQAAAAAQAAHTAQTTRPYTTPFQPHVPTAAQPVTPAQPVPTPAPQPAAPAAVAPAAQAPAPVAQAPASREPAQMKPGSIQFHAIPASEYGLENMFRRYPRVPLFTAVIVHNGRQYHHTQSVDISEKGLMLRMQDTTAYEKGEEIVVTIRNMPGIGTFSTPAVIMRVIRTQEVSGYGIFFLRLNPLHRRKISEYILTRLNTAEAPGHYPEDQGKSKKKEAPAA